MYLDRRLWAFTAGVRLRIAGAVLLGILAAAAGIARLALLGWLLARVIGGAPLERLLGLAALVAGVIVLRGALEYARTMVAHETAVRVQTRLRETLYDHLTRLGPAVLGNERTGEVVLSLVEGIQQLEIYFGQYLPQLAVAALTPLLIFAFVAFVDLPIALALLAAALVTLVAPAAWHRHDSRRSRARQEAYAAFAAEYLDAIQGLGTLKAFGQSRARGARLETRARELFRRTMGVLGTNTLARGITDTGMAVGAAVALGWGAYRVQAGEMSLEALLIVLMLGVEVFRPLRELRVLLHTGMLGRAAADGILRLLDARPLVLDEAHPAVDAAALPPTVAFEAVSFAYPGGRRPALSGLSFAVEAGARTGIVGASGAGKSTIARLLLRFYDPQEGRVLVGGHDARALGLDALRSRMALVSQETYLFHGTVEENLRMGKRDATAEELEAAARAANAHEFIARLPQGYRTVVGERGVRLSGGERQRIAIARALLRDAPILILDEALSSVDAESEAIIQEALERLMAGRTTLVIAHRLSSVVGADRILVLEDGRLVESGRHAELIARRGAYLRLMGAQATDNGAGRGDRLDLSGRGASCALPSTASGLWPGPPLRVVLRHPLDAPAGEPAAEPETDVIRADGAGSAGGAGWATVLRTLLGLSRGHRGQLAVTFILGVARVSALIGVGVVSALVVLAVKRGEPLGGWLLLLGAVAPLAGILHWLESWLAHDVAYRLLADMRIAFFRKLDALAPAYLVRRRSGDLVGVATQDIELIEYFFAHTITPAGVAVLVPTVVLATVAVHGWPMAMVLVPWLAYAGLSPILGRRRIDRLGARAREAAGELTAHAVDTVQGVAEILAFQQVRPRGRELAARAEAYLRARMPFLRDLTRGAALQEVATGFGGLAVATVGGLLVAGGRLDGAMLPLLTLLAMSAFVPVWEIAQVGRQLADTLAATRRVHAVQAEPVPVTDGPGVPAGTRAGVPALEMGGVTFRYPGQHRPALLDVAFTVPAGTTLALVGPSGAGKTTIAHLLLRFWDPSAGAVRLQGHDLRAYPLDDLRRRIALVAQDTYLFNDTLEANIRLARPDASEGAIREAVRDAALDELVATLPEGLDTVVGERGAQLSGGQRQRVAIARAFLKGAPVLILDEATSHLDGVSEQAVQAALERLARGRTTVVIAHRLSTVRAADRIVVLDEGRVIETGTHDTLLRRGGLYARLVSRQLPVGVSRPS